jgi:hypothetical protein
MIEISQGRKNSMSTNSNTMVKLVGMVLLIGGIGMVFWGYQMSGALTSKLAKGITGALPDEVMYRYIGGAISSVAGLFLLMKR